MVLEQGRSPPLVVLFNVYLFWLCRVHCGTGLLLQPSSPLTVYHSFTGCLLRCGAQAVGALASVVLGPGPEAQQSNWHRLGCSVACGMFPDQESNTCLLHCQADSLLREPPGKPWLLLLLFLIFFFFLSVLALWLVRF